MTLNCPICNKELPTKFGLYKEDAIHDIHSFVDDMNEGLHPLGDPVLIARLKERIKKTGT
jgi:hypothetical protein